LLPRIFSNLEQLPLEHYLIFGDLMSFVVVPYCRLMPAYNAARILEKKDNDMPHEFVDEVILVENYEHDRTAELPESLGIKVFTTKVI